MDKIAVLIPCYNESKTIEKVVTDFKKVLPEAVIYVYDNNSTDHTDEIARRAGAVVRYEYQQAKETLFAGCFVKLMHSVISWQTEMILIPQNLPLQWLRRY